MRARGKDFRAQSAKRASCSHDERPLAIDRSEPHTHKRNNEDGKGGSKRRRGQGEIDMIEQLGEAELYLRGGSDLDRSEI